MASRVGSEKIYAGIPHQKNLLVHVNPWCNLSYIMLTLNTHSNIFHRTCDSPISLMMTRKLYTYNGILVFQCLDSHCCIVLSLRKCKWLAALLLVCFIVEIESKSDFIASLCVRMTCQVHRACVTSWSEHHNGFVEVTRKKQYSKIQGEEDRITYLPHYQQV